MTAHEHVLRPVMPPLLEAMSPAVREGVARRRVQLATGRCPCGAEGQVVAVFGRTVCVASRHVAGCEATLPAVQAIVNREVGIV